MAFSLSANQFLGFPSSFEEMIVRQLGIQLCLPGNPVCKAIPSIPHKDLLPHACQDQGYECLDVPCTFTEGFRKETFMKGGSLLSKDYAKFCRGGSVPYSHILVREEKKRGERGVDVYSSRTWTDFSSFNCLCQEPCQLCLPIWRIKHFQGAIPHM